MGGRYRAVLIGNSTYPADAHNLQTLKGPVKDIAVLNRALVDPGGGFFADVDVTLLPEVSSTRAIRALSKFFGEADRDDVLLVYFSGHGKLDQRGRLHLCMQDTETTDLLSTAVSSVRINEFAEASRARNVVIILDCCYAGAFRSSDLGDAVAGPGRYVMTSCRSTELANDATVDNGTSFFTQHLVDGLLNAADHDEDGYVRFSDLYGYVDRRLREAGKQIPQRRVEGDGDLPLAKRARRSSDEAATTAPVKAPALPAPPPPAIPPAATDRRSAWPRKRVLAGIAVAVALIGGGVAAWLTLGPDGAGAHSSGFDMTYTAAAPWRVRIDGTAYGNGCTVALTHTASGEPIPVPDNIYGVEQYQITRTGAFRLHVNDRQCFVTPLAGSGKAKLPFVWEQGGDTDAFAPPAAGVRVEVTDFKGGSRCALRLFDATSQAELDTKTLEKGSSSSVIMDPLGRSSVYLFDDDCTVKISAPD
jgi:Caspase domain